MYHSINEIIDYKLIAKDGEFGKCNDFLFEDRPWIVRYMVAETGGFLNRQKVLIPLVELEKPDRSTQLFHIDLTKQQIEESPSLSENEPVSRQYERISYLYFGWPAHWAEDELENTASTPSGVFRKQENAQESVDKESSLRSVKEVTGYHVDATDGKVGSVNDFIVDDNIWAIRYLVVDIGNSVKDKKVLLAPDWVNT
ncbi:MAG: PRC-barrel domain containing protein, partial [Thermodesulfobacteriota bacterium]|nr:PRC-barrel domain containing protein [Thermodesulfobacteriota bacterium]